MFFLALAIGVIAVQRVDAHETTSRQASAA